MWKPGGRIPGWLPILLGFLQAVGPMSTDMYLPAFPAIEASLHAPRRARRRSRSAPGYSACRSANWCRARCRTASAAARRSWSAR